VGIPIIVVTGVGTVGAAVEAMKAGAFDFVQKPIDPAELVLLVRRAAEHRGLLSEVRKLRHAVEDLREARDLIGSSAAMRGVKESIAKVAPTDTTVLVLGESGTGKELAAQGIHARSARAENQIVRVNCAALSDEAFDRELFEVRTGKVAEAEGGTLLLDEIGLSKLASQTKLLGLLERGEYQVAGEPRTRRADVRVVAISNEDLAAKVKSGAFRADLYYRLNPFPIEMPALRTHKEDIPEIAAYMLERARRRQKIAASGGPSAALGREALEVLASYDWPGNVRELGNAIERAVIVAGTHDLDAELFRGILESALPSGRPMEANEFHLRRNLDALEKDIVLKAISHTQGKKKEASILLGIDPRNLGYYLRKHKIRET
jgi:DNA-binding NtrC family response regulator